jgi:hypothetical protein
LSPAVASVPESEGLLCLSWSSMTLGRTWGRCFVDCLLVWRVRDVTEYIASGGCRASMGQSPFHPRPLSLTSRSLLLSSASRRFSLTPPCAHRPLCCCAAMSCTRCAAILGGLHGFKNQTLFFLLRYWGLNPGPQAC